MKALARQYTEQAVLALAAALKRLQHAVAAAQVLLGYGWGKPVQMITGDPQRPVAIDFSWADATKTPLQLPTAPIIDAEPFDKAMPLIPWAGEK